MSQSHPLVTVIIPTYGRPAFLDEAIGSVVAQSYDNVEVLVVDDCSPTPVELATRDPRVTIIRHDRNQGPGAARNTALRQSRGDLIVFLDDDDLFSSDRIDRGVRELGSARMHVVATNVNSRRFEGDMRSSLHHENPPSILQVMVRRQDVVEFDPALRVSEDIDWWIRMRDQAIFAWSGMPGLWVRQHDGPRVGVDPTVRRQCRETVARRHAGVLDRRSNAHQWARVAQSSLEEGSRRATLESAFRSLSACPTALGVKLALRGLTPGSSWARP